MVAAVAVVAGVSLAVHLGLLGGSGQTPGEWQVVNFPTGFSADTIACSGADDCWVLATTTSTPTNPSATPATSAIWHYSGGGWTRATLAAPGTLEGLSCVDATDCGAVGDHYTVPPGANDGVVQPLLEHSDGAAFTTVAGPVVSGDADVLTAVTCVNADGCWAVGTVEGAAWDLVGTPPPETTPPLIEHYTGAAWTVVAGPPVGNGGVGLEAVTCLPSTDRCHAVGGTLVETLDGA